MRSKAGKHNVSWRASMLLSAIIGVSHVSIASAASPEGQPAKLGKGKIEIALTANKGPVTTSLTTGSSKVTEGKQGTLMIPDKSKTLQMGGVSDGGGNAVGSVLFDFYENQDSEQISLEQLLALEPLTQQMIQKLNQQVPAVGEFSNTGLGAKFIQHLQSKKVYLENKAISSAGCLNESMVAAEEQKIVACQSDTELRINKQWLKSTDSKNRAGLILHEMALAWLRVQLKETHDKQAIEQKVRELNRAVFNSKSSDEMARAVYSIVDVPAFSIKNFALLKQLPEKLKAASEIFCKDPTQGARAQLHEYFADPILYRALPWEIPTMEVTAQSLNDYHSTQEAAKLEKRVKRLCVDYELDQIDMKNPYPNTTRDCAEFENDTWKQASMIVDNTKGSSLDPDTRKELTALAIEKIKQNAYSCYVKNGRQDGVLLQLPKLVKWNLKTKEGIEISFINRTASK